MTQPETNSDLIAESKAWKARISADIDDLTEPGEVLLDLAGDAYVRLRIAQRDLLRDGSTVTDRFKQRRPHPATSAAQRAELSIIGILEKVIGDGDKQRFLNELNLSTNGATKC